MRTSNFQTMFEAGKKWSNLVILPLGSVILILSLFIFHWLFIAAMLLLCIWLMMHALWFVPTGYIGYKRVFGKLKNKSYQDGIKLIVPFITDTYLMDVTQITKDIHDVKKVKTRNNITLDVTLTYQVDERYVHLIFQYMKENYFETHLSKWIDATFDTIVSQRTYAEFQSQKAEIEHIVSALIVDDIDKRCSELTKDTGKTHAVTSYEVVTATECVPNPAKDPTNPAHAALPDYISVPVMIPLEIDDETTEYVPKLELVEFSDTREGVNFFKSMDVKINKVSFEETYEQARAKVAVAKAQTAEANEKKKQAEILAEAKKIALIKEGEAKAEAYLKMEQAKAEGLKLTLASENDAKNHLGEIIARYPGVLKNELAKNFPKVFGGNTMVNLDDLLGNTPIITK